MGSVTIELYNAGEDVPASGAGRNASPRQGSPVVRECSKIRTLTTKPYWDQNFTLGPVTSKHSTVRIACYHHTGKELLLAPSSARDDDSHFIGDVIFKIGDLIIDDQVVENNDHGEVVGWFPLGNASANSCVGEATSYGK